MNLLDAITMVLWSVGYGIGAAILVVVIGTLLMNGRPTSRERSALNFIAVMAGLAVASWQGFSAFGLESIGTGVAGVIALGTLLLWVMGGNLRG